MCCFLETNCFQECSGRCENGLGAARALPERRPTAGRNSKHTELRRQQQPASELLIQKERRVGGRRNAKWHFINQSGLKGRLTLDPKCHVHSPCTTCASDQPVGRPTLEKLQARNSCCFENTSRPPRWSKSGYGGCAINMWRET